MSANDPFLHRVSELNDAPVRDGRYVLYWMQSSQRATCNHALEWAVRLANERRLPVVTAFGLTPDYPESSARHYTFMLEGLKAAAAALRGRGVTFVLRVGDPPGVALDLGREAAAIVCDRGYLARLRRWRSEVARTAGCHVVEVESDLVVPVEAASSKAEYAARTIRPRIHRRLGDFLVPLEEPLVGVRSLDPAPRGESVDDTEALLARLAPRPDPASVSRFLAGGYPEARRRLDRFLTERLEQYEISRNEPGLDVGSGLSPYLHFGQISSLAIAIEAGASDFVRGMEEGRGEMRQTPGSVGMRTGGGARASARDAFLEELLVRRGLSHNYVWFTPGYETYDTLPDWARRSLASHADDPRPNLYTGEQLMRAQTHDEHWNHAMRELLVTGFMHNYMRMYWGKKVLEWTATPREAYERLLWINNHLFVDGRDPNSYANVGWVFGLHDRPWTERPIFGTIRYMNASGLKRKFNMELYHRKVDRLVRFAEGTDEPDGL